MANQFNIQSKIVWALTICLLVGGMVYAVGQKKRSITTGVHIDIQNVNEDNLVNEAVIHDKLIDINPDFFNNPMVGDINLAAIEEYLQYDGFIKEADVYMDVNNQIQIDIVQRIPILRVIDSYGDSYYMDREGVQVPISEGRPARVVVFTGNIEPFADTYGESENHDLKAVFELGEYIYNSSFLKALTEQVHVDENKQYVIIPKLGNQKIILGDMEDIDEKINKLELFYKEAMSKRGWNRYAHIDLRYKDQVVCKKHKSFIQ